MSFSPQKNWQFSREIKVEFLDKKWRFRTVCSSSQVLNIFFGGPKVDMTTSLLNHFLIMLLFAKHMFDACDYYQMYENHFFREKWKKISFWLDFRLKSLILNWNDWNSYLDWSSDLSSDWSSDWSRLKFRLKYRLNFKLNTRLKFRLKFRLNFSLKFRLKFR